MTAQTRNPIALRLYKVLGTNFSDDATKEALRTISELYIPSTVPGRGDEGLEITPGESAARARKNLRRDMENKLAEGSREFLKAFGEVDQVCLFLSVSEFRVLGFDIYHFFGVAETGRATRLCFFDAS